MAKTSKIAKNEQRKRTVALSADRRAELKRTIVWFDDTDEANVLVQRYETGDGLDRAAVAARMARQALLYDPDRTLRFLIGEPDLIEVELETAKVDITDPEQTAVYREAFERLSAVALTGESAAELIRRIRRELLSGAE